MKLTFLLFSFFFSAILVHSQESFTITNGCGFDRLPGTSDIFVSEPPLSMERSLEELLIILGISSRVFELKTSNVQTAIATIVEGKRYILYSLTFLDQIISYPQKNSWVQYSIMAHEIGHHMLGHDFFERDPEKRKLMELEADEFSGALLRLLCAKKKEALIAIKRLPRNSKHLFYPPITKRRNFIVKGWKRQNVIKRERDPCQ